MGVTYVWCGVGMVSTGCVVEYVNGRVYVMVKYMI